MQLVSQTQMQRRFSLLDLIPGQVEPVEIQVSASVLLVKNLRMIQPSYSIKGRCSCREGATLSGRLCAGKVNEAASRLSKSRNQQREAVVA